MKKHIAVLLALITFIPSFSQQRLRDYGITPGVFQPGKYNAITDVSGVKVGHVTLIEGDDVRTGVTAIIPHEGNVFRKKCPAAVFVSNGFGKMAGSTQIKELGNIETPIILTNTLSVASGIQGLITYTLSQKGNEHVKSVNAVVGETNDGELNDIRKRVVTEKHVLEAIKKAKGGPVEEGNVGAGTGTLAFGYKGGIGTSSRVLPAELGGYTVGVLVQTNYEGILEIDGIQAGKKLKHYRWSKLLEPEIKEEKPAPDGSCMMVVFTDAPIDARNLERMAKRAAMAVVKTGGCVANGSGEYVIAVSVNKDNLINEKTQYYFPTLLQNGAMTQLFEAAVEATSEAIWNAMLAAKTMTGCGVTYEALPMDRLKDEITTYINNN